MSQDIVTTVKYELVINFRFIIV